MATFSAEISAFARRRRTLAGAVVAAVGAGVLYRALTSKDAGSSRAIELQRSITVERPRDDVYRRWREPQTQPLVWSHVVEVTDATEHGAHWRIEAPLGRTFEWDTRIVEERDGELIRWESTGGDVPNEGSVEFRDAPGEHGTEVVLCVRFDPPAGALGKAAARVFDDPPKLVLAKALRRFKSLVETGEIPSTDRNPSARES